MGIPAMAHNHRGMFSGLPSPHSGSAELIFTKPVDPFHILKHLVLSEAPVNSGLEY